MTEWLLSTSTLILCVLLLRRLLRGKLRPWVQYALWLVVALRLLLPTIPIHNPWSVPSLASGITEQAEILAPLAEIQVPILPAPKDAPGPEHSNLDEAEYQTMYGPRTAPLWKVLWFGGSLATLLLMCLRNLLLIRRIYQTRIIQPEYNAPVPVYAVPHLPSPCLFHGRVYLPLELRDPVAQYHAVTHEVAHNKHYDNYWNLLRCFLCVLFWWNPLVWAAAWASRADMELACDEAAITHLGEQSRIAYGRTLLDLVKVQGVSDAPDPVPTTMTSGKRSLKIRIETIAHKPVTRRWAVILLCAVMLLACFTTFTGAGTGSILVAHRRFPADVLNYGQVYADGVYGNDLPAGLCRELGRCIQDAHWDRIPEDEIFTIYKPGYEWRVRLYPAQLTELTEILLTCRPGWMALTFYAQGVFSSRNKAYYFRLSREAFGEELLKQVQDCLPSSAQPDMRRYFGLYPGASCTAILEEDAGGYRLGLDEQTLYLVPDDGNSIYYAPAKVRSLLGGGYDAIYRTKGNEALFFLTEDDNCLLVTRHWSGSSSDYNYKLLYPCAPPEK